jgi:Replication-relaxation
MAVPNTIPPRKGRSKKLDRRKLFHLTRARLSVVEILANFGVGTWDQIAKLHFGESPTETNLRQVRQLTFDLENEGYIRFLPWFQRVYGLTAKGVAEAVQRDMSDPYELSPDKSLENVEHEVKRTETHAAIEALSDKHGWPLRWRKTNLYRTIEPDDLFTLQTTNFFFEEENKKKTHEALYAKAKRYFDYCDTQRCENQWHFRKPYVLFQFATKERMMNFLDYLTGRCSDLCYERGGKMVHMCLKKIGKPPITTGNFIFTFDEAIWNETDSTILYRASDYAKRSYSFAELITP